MRRTFIHTLRLATVSAVVLTLAGSGNHLLAARGLQAREPHAAQVSGGQNRVQIRRDGNGVAHVQASTEAAALYGLGYVHAQDRLWQMEFQRRLGNGRLAEILGDGALPTDSLFRTIGLARSATAAWEALSPAERKPIAAYVAGVNAVINDRVNHELPPEYGILGFEPEPYRPEDAIVWAKVITWSLSSNWDKELLGAQIAAKLGPAKAAELMPAYTSDGPTILPPKKLAAKARRLAPAKVVQPALGLDATVARGLLDLNSAIEAQTGLGADGFGSNSWVLGAKRTTTGKPLLANDPHLSSQTPAIWYLARITGGGLDVSGATIPGIPGVAVGHNRDIAWGVSTINVDCQDVYVEHVNDRNEAEFMGAFEPLTIVPETIKVKGKPDVHLQVRISRHGPLISDIINPAGQPLALRWTGNDPADSAILAVIGMNRARNWREFTDAAREHRAPDQNYVFADRQGNIGYIAPGTIPMRAKGDGRLPSPGWTGEYEWTGYVPFDELPTAFNPPEGYIATANNKVAGDDYPHLIGTSFAIPYRAARVVEMIESRPRLSPLDMAKMQADVLAVHAREVLPFMLRTAPLDERGRRAIDLLRGWDARVKGESAQAAIFEAWYLALGERLFADELGDALWRTYSENIYMVAMALEAAVESGSPWCDDVRTPQVETVEDVLAAALADGLAKMTAAQGTDDLAAWRWDRAHVALFPHSPFDSNPQLRPIFSRSIPNGGDKFTVNVASVFRWAEYNQLHSAQYRQIADFRDLDDTRMIVAPGQSGDPESPHYDDMLERWQRVEYLSFRTVDKAAKEGAADELLVVEH